MENDGPVKTTLFEHALNVGLGIFNSTCDIAPDSVDKPAVQIGTRTGRISAKKPNKSNKPKHW